MSASLTGRRWVLPPQRGGEEEAALAAALELPLPLARLLLARGLGPPSAAAFLRPAAPTAWERLPGTEAAVARLVAARQRGEGVLVYGDYDCDGVCAAALAHGALTALGLRAAVHLPDRAQGYGLQAATLPGLAAAAGCGLVLAVDNGATAHGAVAAAQAAGVEVIVADHHQFDGGPPPAAAVVSPMLDPGGPFSGLAGVGVAWCLTQALAAALGMAAPPALDLVAIGTVADVVPLLGANRWLVREGLAAMAAGRSRPGVAALLQACGVARGTPPSARDLSHGLAPRLNAPGRIDRPHPAYALLAAATEPEALAALAAVEDCNRRRQDLAAAVVAAAEAAAAAEPGDSRALVLADARWHPGLLGPAAASLAERLRVPVLLGTIDEQGLCRGSGRGPEGFDLTGALRACRGLLLRFGGHAQAAGFELEAARLGELRAALSALAPVLGPEGAGEADLALDGGLAPEEVTLALAEALDALGPFGEANPEPAFLLRAAGVEEARAMGRDGRHARLRLRVGPGPRPTAVPGLAFGLGQWAEALAAGGPFDLVVRPCVDRYRGRTALQLQVLDAMPSSRDPGRMVAAARVGLARTHPDRDGLAAAFRRLRALAREGALPPEPALLRQLAPGCLPGEEAARAALRIFEEVGLLDERGQLRLPPGGAKVDLGASARFRSGEAARRAVTRLEAGGGAQ